MKNRAEVRVSAAAIAQNIARAKGDSSAEVLAVVKANAYGHGLIPVATTALKSGATWLGTALLEEAIELRTAGITAPTIAWLTPPGEDFSRAIELNIDLGISSLAVLQEVSQAAEKLGTQARIHIEVDTGMTRGGFLDEWSQLLAFLQTANAEVVGLWTHFARADEPTSDFTEIQLNNFEAKLAELKEAGIVPRYVHCANSAAIIRGIGTSQNILRIGIAMYGLSPDYELMGSGQSLGLAPAMTVAAKLALVKRVPAGSAIGYGGTAITQTETVIGVVAMGYSDGIPRNATSDAGVVHNGKKAPIIGRVSMDQFVVDLGADSVARSGDEVVVIGESGFSADDWARACGTINYEIVTRIAARLPRILV